MALKIMGYTVSFRINLKIKKIEESLQIDQKIQRTVINSYSQLFEDIFIENIFKGKNEGFYIDIGAHHPSGLSNTKKFYDKGWRGINIEPNTSLYRKFIYDRPDDINLNVGIGNQNTDMIFYEIDDPALSTFNQKVALRTVKDGQKIIKDTLVPVITLVDLFKNYTNGKKVDFLSIDTEGFEFEVFSSNDWSLYRPTLIIAEINHDEDNRVSKLLSKENYILIYNNGLNGIFIDKFAINSQNVNSQSIEGA